MLPSLSVVVVLAVALQAQSSPPLRNGPLPGPLPLFPAGNWWNQDISAAPVDARSAQLVAFINNGGTRRLHPDFGGYESPGSENIYGFPYVVVAGDQPKIAVQFDYTDESDGVDHTTGLSFPFYPIPEEAKTQPYWIEGGPPGDSGATGDRHMLIVDRDNKHLYELFALAWNGTQWTAGSGAFFDLNTNGRRPDGWTSADAAGLAILPGLVRYDEAFGADEIRHAFRVTVRATNGYVWPASHRAGSNESALPMGARLRLKPSVNLAPYPAEVQRIFRAMQRYGLIVADNGSDMYISGTFDPRWDNGVLNPAFRALTANDFEVIELGWRGAACTTPGPPQALSSTVTGQLVQLNWLEPVGGGQHEYILEAGSRAGVTDIASITLPNTPAFSVVAPAGNYYVRARARNGCGSSAPSNEILVSVGGCAVPPAPTNFRVTRAGAVVTLDWNASIGASDYILEVGSNPGAGNLLVVPLPAGPISATAPQGTYYARMRGRNGCGVGSPSNELTVIIP
jgi:hypothetical protein